jgi:hypothetical protein
MPTAIRTPSSGGGDDDRDKRERPKGATKPKVQPERVQPGELRAFTDDSHNPSIKADKRRASGQEPARDAYLAAVQDRSTYLTTNELAKMINCWPEQVYRWCVKWFGTLPGGRKGRSMGYRIPPVYLYVARAFQQVEDPGERKLLQEVITADPKNFVLLVGKTGSTHYSAKEVVERLDSILPLVRQQKLPVRVLYVGPMDTNQQQE